MTIDFRPGDIFCTVNPSKILGKGIDLIERLRTPTSEGQYTHAGIMISPHRTYESLWTVKSQNLWEGYEGKQIIMGRFKEMNTVKYMQGMEKVLPYKGKLYPFPRLLLFLLLPITVKYMAPSRFFGLGFFADVVCSELAGMFCKYAGMEGFRQFRGLMPAHLANRIKRWEAIETIFEGVLA